MRAADAKRGGAQAQIAQAMARLSKVVSLRNASRIQNKVNSRHHRRLPPPFCLEPDIQCLTTPREGKNTLPPTAFLSFKQSVPRKKTRLYRGDPQGHWQSEFPQQEDMSQGQYGLHNEFQGKQDYIETLPQKPK